MVSPPPSPPPHCACVALAHLCVEHDLRRPVPPGGDVLRERPGVVVVGVGDAGQAKVADAEVAVGVLQDNRGWIVEAKNTGVDLDRFSCQFFQHPGIVGFPFHLLTSRRFDGLRSLCRTLAEWMYLSPLRIW